MMLRWRISQSRKMCGKISAVWRGSKGIAVLPSRALQPYIRYVFDIGDTGGKEQSLTWNLEGDNLKGYLISEGVAVLAEADRKLQFNLLKAFIKRQIRGIIKEDFAKRMTQLNMLAGRVITDHDEETPELAVQRLVINSILYAVGTRCGFSLSSEEQDLSLIVNISDVDNIYALGSLVCDVSCTVLRSMNQSITQMERERRKYERTGVLSYGKFGNEHPNLQDNLGRQENGGNYGISNQLSQGRTRDDVLEYRSGAGETPAGKIRNHGNGISGAEPQGTLSDVKNDGQAERSVTAGGGGSEPASGGNHESLFEKAPAEAEGFHDGNVENQRAGTEGSGGNRDDGSHQQIPLNEPVDETVQAELNKELDELNSLGMEQREAEYHQASLFDYMGQMGAGWLIEGYGLHGYDTFHSNGIRLQWRDAEGETEGYLSWKSVEAEIGALILTGEYYTPHVSMDELLDDDREDIIDGEYREVEEAQQELTDDEIEEILEADRQIADERYEKQQEEGQASASPKSNPPTVADIDFVYIEPADVEFEDNFFDVVVGNVPFGDFKMYDKKHNPQEFKIHDYFIAKSIDVVRPGGIVAVVTTKGTLDKQNSTVRRYFAQRAELVGVIRLPNMTFKENAGTEVTSDILFFQKRERKITAEPDWIHLSMTGDGIPVNSYFAEHPQMMLGQMEYDRGRFGENSRYTVCVNREKNFSLYQALQEAVANIHTELVSFEREMEKEKQAEEYIPANPDVKNFTYTFVDGKLYYRKDSRMYVQEMGDKAVERIKGMDAIRDAVRHLIKIQYEGCNETELKEGQERLNDTYDSYVKKMDILHHRQMQGRSGMMGIILCSVRWRWWMKTALLQRQICSQSRR